MKRDEAGDRRRDDDDDDDDAADDDGLAAAGGALSRASRGLVSREGEHDDGRGTVNAEAPPVRRRAAATLVMPHFMVWTRCCRCAVSAEVRIFYLRLMQRSKDGECVCVWLPVNTILRVR
jgi:hypothetical protein